MLAAWRIWAAWRVAASKRRASASTDGSSIPMNSGWPARRSSAKEMSPPHSRNAWRAALRRKPIWSSESSAAAVPIVVDCS